MTHLLTHLLTLLPSLTSSIHLTHLLTHLTHSSLASLTTSFTSLTSLTPHSSHSPPTSLSHLPHSPPHSSPYSPSYLPSHSLSPSPADIHFLCPRVLGPECTPQRPSYRTTPPPAWRASSEISQASSGRCSGAAAWGLLRGWRCPRFSSYPKGSRMSFLVQTPQQ